MPVVKQTNLGGGILRPHLWARTDMPKYPSFVRRAENFFVTPTGQLSNRPGWVYLDFARWTTNWGQNPARLLPFIFADGQSYVLEFTSGFLRIWKEGVLLANINGAGANNIATPYTYAQIEDVKYSQVGDELYLFHHSMQTYVLRRNSETNWTITAVSFDRTVTAPGSLAFSGTIDQTGDATHPPKEWSWKVTAWNADLTDESLPSTALTPGGTGKIVITEDKPVTISWGAVSGTTRYSIYRGRNNMFGYVGDAIGQTTFRDDGQTPVLSSGPPNQYDPYRLDFHPYTAHATQDQFPAVGTFYNQRLVLANFPGEPGGAVFSRLGQFRNFDYLEPAVEDDGFEFYLASRRFEEIRDIIPMDGYLIVLTNAGEWICVASDGSMLDATSLPSLRPQSTWGSSWLDPIQIGNSVIYQQEGGFPIRQFVVNSNGYQNNDLCVLSGLPKNDPIVGWCYQRRPYSLIWGYDEYGQMYAMTLDETTQALAWTRHSTPNGKVISLCCVPEGGEDAVYACIGRAVNNSGFAIAYTIERMAARNDENPLTPEACFQDCSNSFSGENTDPLKQIVVGEVSNVSRGQTVTLISSSAIFAAADIGDWIVLHPRFPDHAIYLEVLTYASPTQVTARVLDRSVIEPDPDWKPNPDGIYGWMGSFVLPIPPFQKPPDDISDTVFPFSFAEWGWARSTFEVSIGMMQFVQSVSSPLDFTPAVVKADGKYYELADTMVTTNPPGAAVGPLLPLPEFFVTIPEPAVFVTIGLPYTQVIETLDIPYVVGQGVDQTLSVKTIKNAGFLVTKTSEGFQVGESPDGPKHPWKPEVGMTDTADFGPGTEDMTFTGLVNTPVFNSWNRQGRIALVNTTPTPVTVCGILREFELGGT